MHAHAHARTHTRTHTHTHTHAYTYTNIHTHTYTHTYTHAHTHTHTHTHIHIHTHAHTHTLKQGIHAYVIRGLCPVVYARVSVPVLTSIPCRVSSIIAAEIILSLLRREGFILSTRFARIDPTECFFLFHLNRRRRGMTDRWQCESICISAIIRSIFKC